MLGADPAQSTADNYRRFARSEVRGKSPLYEQLCEGVADDRKMLDFLAQLPLPKRQPNLLLAAVRVLFGVQPNYERFRAAVLEHRGEIAALMRSRRTQTNEPWRCAALLPILCALPQPLALLEVGAAAGLCLLPDHYGYDYGCGRVGADAVVFPCVPYGEPPVPRELPRVVWRTGIDLEPIDLGDPESVTWLEALVWPEEGDRLERLRAAIAIARRERPRVVRANLLDALPRLASQAPADATLVVFHTAVIAYLSPADRERFREQVASLRAVWVSSEGRDVFPGIRVAEMTPAGRSYFVIARDGHAVALCDPHGRWIQWL
jgi:hypothetical protein